MLKGIRPRRRFYLRWLASLATKPRERIKDMRFSNDIASFRGARRRVFRGSCGRSFPLAPIASLSLVLRDVQEGGVLRSLSSAEMCVRRKLFERLHLSDLRRMEYLARLELALSGLFVKGN
jgi:hypothetical protein